MINIQGMSPDLISAMMNPKVPDASPLQQFVQDYQKQQQMALQNQMAQRRMGMDEERLGFERERLGREAAREPFLLRSAETQAKLGEENLSYLPQARRIEEEQKRAAAALDRSHANYYDVMGGVAQRKVGEGTYKDQTDRAKVYRDILQRTSLFQNRDEWERENQPGGILNIAFGGPQNWDSRNVILAQARQRVAAPPDVAELLEQNFTPDQIRDIQRQNSLRRALGPPKVGHEWAFDEQGNRYQRVIQERSDAKDTISPPQIMRMMTNLDRAFETLVGKPNEDGRIPRPNMLRDGLRSANDKLAEVTGGRIGYNAQAVDQAFTASRHAVLQLSYALSGKSIGQAEQQRIIETFVPLPGDTPERRAFKINEAKLLFTSLLDARKRGATPEALAKMYESALERASSPADLPDRRRPAPSPRNDLKNKYGLE